MAEVKKKFSQLDPGSVPFTGTEIIAAVQGGQSKRGTISGIHGAGWWDQLKATFVDFIAPDALHANDADTIGGETSAELRNAGALTGTLPLGVIPAELTGKNAATATSAAKLTNARTITVNGDATGSVSFDGSANRTLTLDVTYATAAGSAGYATSAGSATSATTAASAAKLTTARTITVNGDATGSVSFDGSANRTLTLDVTYATSAGSAWYATNAGYAKSAGSADYATSAGSATSATNAAIAGSTLNTFGASRPASGPGQHGRFFYQTAGTPGLYYCTRTAESTYTWLKISE